MIVILTDRFIITQCLLYIITGKAELEKDLAPAGSLTKWIQQPDLCQLKAWSQELLLGLVYGCRGPRF